MVGAIIAEPLPKNEDTSVCLIAIAYQAHEHYPLIVAANRDEFYQRPTAAAEPWTDAPQLLAGRDLRQGGTWLGLTLEGRFAAITNVRNGHLPPLPAARSRGQLPLRWLNHQMNAAELAEELDHQSDQYEGFNLLCYDGDALSYLSNRAGHQLALKPGVYGLSNASLNTPWPKVRRATSALQNALNTEHPELESLFRLLADPLQAPPGTLPDTGIALDWERLLSSCFIRSDNYGTRASTLLVQDRQGRWLFLERSFVPGLPVSSRGFTRRTDDGNKKGYWGSCSASFSLPVSALFASSESVV